MRLCFLLPHLSNEYILFRIMAKDFSDGHFQILLYHVDTPLAESVHSGFGADALADSLRFKLLIYYFSIFIFIV